MSILLNIPQRANLDCEKSEDKNLIGAARIYENQKIFKYSTNSNDFDFHDCIADSFNDFLQNLPSVIVRTTTSGQIRSLNTCAETLFGYAENEVVGQDVVHLFGPDVELKTAIAEVEPARGDDWQSLNAGAALQARKKNGELFPVTVLINLSTPGQHIFHITDRSVETRQAQQIAELEREVAHLARHSLLGELATTITHELAQPLTAITNYTAAATRWSADADASDMEPGLDMMAKAGEQAKRAWVIMHRLRKLLQHRDTEFVDDDLRIALNEAVQLSTLGASQHGIDMTVEMPDAAVIVRMDRIQIQILLANLIRNAIDELRFWKGERKLWIKLALKGQDQAEVSVEDTGPGIAPEVYANIFDPFMTTKPKGLGIGLAVSRRIARAHGGTLAAHNRALGGASFGFRVPLSSMSIMSISE